MVGKAANGRKSHKKEHRNVEICIVTLPLIHVQYSGYKSMYWKRLIMRGVSEINALIQTIHPPVPSYRILMYHSIGEEVIGDRLNIFSISSGLFEKHIEYLANQREKTIVDLNVTHLNTKSDCITVTFDDGYKDNLYTAAPILEKYSFPYTVFVSSGFVESEYKYFLSPNELRKLAELPNSNIGAHSVSHVSLVECNNKDLENELVSSKHYIEDIIGMPVNKIAYPYGAVDKRVRDAAENAGYTFGTCSYMYTNRSDYDQLLLSRTSILGIDSLRIFKQKISGYWDWYRYLQRNPSLK